MLNSLGEALPVDPDVFEDHLRRCRETVEPELCDLKARSKPLSQLVVSEMFTVADVLSQSWATSFTPRSEVRVGGVSPVYSGGLCSQVVLQVIPSRSEIPVATLLFEGYSAVRAGELIVAKIPRYEEKRAIFLSSMNYPSRNTLFYLERPFRPEESAIELAILSSDGNVVRQERAADYSRFFPR